MADTGFWKVEHKDFFGIVWGGILFQTADEVAKKWVSLFSDAVTVTPSGIDEVDGYKAGGFEVIDLEEI